MGQSSLSPFSAFSLSRPFPATLSFPRFVSLHPRPGLPPEKTFRKGRAQEPRSIVLAPCTWTVDATLRLRPGSAADTDTLADFSSPPSYNAALENLARTWRARRRGTRATRHALPSKFARLSLSSQRIRNTTCERPEQTNSTDRKIAVGLRAKGVV